MNKIRERGGDREGKKGRGRKRGEQQNGGERKRRR
jgi:hypothetical protein